MSSWKLKEKQSRHKLMEVALLYYKNRPMILPSFPRIFAVEKRHLTRLDREMKVGGIHESKFDS